MLSEWLKWTKKQKKLRTAENNSALRKMSLYYDQTIRELKRNGKAYDMQGFFKYYGIYNAYLELRHATVYIVNAKKKENMKTLLGSIETKMWMKPRKSEKY